MSEVKHYRNTKNLDNAVDTWVAPSSTEEWRDASGFGINNQYGESRQEFVGSTPTYWDVNMGRNSNMVDKSNINFEYLWGAWKPQLGSNINMIASNSHVLLQGSGSTVNDRGSKNRISIEAINNLSSGKYNTVNTNAGYGGEITIHKGASLNSISLNNSTNNYAVKDSGEKNSIALADSSENISIELLESSIKSGLEMRGRLNKLKVAGKMATIQDYSKSLSYIDLTEKSNSSNISIFGVGSNILDNGYSNKIKLMEMGNKSLIKSSANSTVIEDYSSNATIEMDKNSKWGAVREYGLNANINNRGSNNSFLFEVAARGLKFIESGSNSNIFNGANSSSISIESTSVGAKIQENGIGTQIAMLGKSAVLNIASWVSGFKLSNGGVGNKIENLSQGANLSMLSTASKTDLSDDGLNSVINNSGKENFIKFGSKSKGSLLEDKGIYSGITNNGNGNNIALKAASFLSLVQDFGIGNTIANAGRYNNIAMRESSKNGMLFESGYNTVIYDSGTNNYIGVNSEASNVFVQQRGVSRGMDLLGSYGSADLTTQSTKNNVLVGGIKNTISDAGVANNIYLASRDGMISESGKQFNIADNGAYNRVTLTGTSLSGKYSGTGIFSTISDYGRLNSITLTRDSMNSTVNAFGRDAVINILGGSGHSVTIGSGNKAILTSPSLSSVSIASKSFSASGEYAKISLMGIGNTLDVSGLKRGSIVTSELQRNTIIGNSDNRISVLVQALSTVNNAYSSVENLGFAWAETQPKSYLAVSAA